MGRNDGIIQKWAVPGGQKKQKRKDEFPWMSHAINTIARALRWGKWKPVQSLASVLAGPRAGDGQPGLVELVDDGHGAE